MPAVFNKSEPVARKDHRCCECWQWIRKGERYLRFDGLWVGEWRTYKRCQVCHVFCIELSNAGLEDDCGGVPFGYMQELIYDYGITEPRIPWEYAPGWLLLEKFDKNMEDLDPGTDAALDYRLNGPPRLPYKPPLPGFYGLNRQQKDWFDRRKWCDGVPYPKD